MKSHNNQHTPKNDIKSLKSSLESKGIIMGSLCSFHKQYSATKDYHFLCIIQVTPWGIYLYPKLDIKGPYNMGSIFVTPANINYINKLTKSEEILYKLLKCL